MTIIFIQDLLKTSNTLFNKIGLQTVESWMLKAVKLQVNEQQGNILKCLNININIST